MLHLDVIDGLVSLFAEWQYKVVYHFVNINLLLVSSVMYCHNVVIFVGVANDTVDAKWNLTVVTKSFDFLAFMFITVPDKRLFYLHRILILNCLAADF